MTRKREFSVPLNLMMQFADIISEWGLACDVTGTGRDNEIIMEVSYEGEEGKGVRELKKLISDY